MPRRTQDPAELPSDFDYRACTSFGWPFNAIRLSSFVLCCGPSTPALSRFGLLPFRSPLLGESFLFSFPAGTKMFQFPAFSHHSLCVQLCVTLHCECRVSPFGHLRIVVCLPLPEAFRRLLRPSSRSQCLGIHRTPFLF